MKSLILTIIVTTCFLIQGCGDRIEVPMVILSKEIIDNETCSYIIEMVGQNPWFYESCDFANVGDTLKIP